MPTSLRSTTRPLPRAINLDSFDRTTECSWICEYLALIGLAGILNERKISCLGSMTDAQLSGSRVLVPVERLSLDFSERNLGRVEDCVLEELLCSRRV